MRPTNRQLHTSKGSWVIGLNMVPCNKCFSALTFLRLEESRFLEFAKTDRFARYDHDCEISTTIVKCFMQVTEGFQIAIINYWITFVLWFGKHFGERSMSGLYFVLCSFNSFWTFTIKVLVNILFCNRLVYFNNQRQVMLQLQCWYHTNAQS